MLWCLHRKRLDALLRGAQKYVGEVYRAPKQSARVCFSLNVLPGDEPVSKDVPADRYDPAAIGAAMRSPNAEETLRILSENTNAGFTDALLGHIRRRRFKDPEVYRAAQLDRRLFSKIVSDRTYKPAKDTCVALCLALRLNLEETGDMLSRAGYALSHSSKRDVALEYFIREGIYDISEINAVLYRLGQKMLGR